MRSLLLLLTACGIQVEGPPATDPAPPLQGSNGVEASEVVGDAYTPTNGDVVFVEPATGTRFNLLGEAFDGERAGTQLGRMPGMSAFWFAWSSHHPGARVWPEGVNNPDAAILSNDQCGVPCEEMITACRGGKDCIPSIDRPRWVTAGSDELGYLVDEDRVLGLTHEGRARAYPLDALWTHEIVNDTWGDWSFSVTYCPLTGSGLVVDGLKDGESLRFGVSGRLFNSNLILYDRASDSLFGQMRQVGLFGDEVHTELSTAAVIDTTWGTWRRMHPDTEVLSERVGTARYPYGDYRTDQTDTFMINRPLPETTYPLKSYAIGLIAGGETVVYPFAELRARVGEQGIVQDTVGGLPVVVVFDLRDDTAAIYSRQVGEDVLTFEMGDTAR